MNLENTFNTGLITGIILLIIILAIWSVIWKAIALWMSARNNNKTWFIIMMIVNTAGILEIIYIFAIAMKKPGAKKNIIEEIKSDKVITEETIKKK